MRRMSTALPVSADGESPSFSSLARMKRSTPLRDQFRFFTAGNGKPLLEFRTHTGFEFKRGRRSATHRAYHWVPLTVYPSAFRCSPPFMGPRARIPGFGGTEIGKALLACSPGAGSSSSGL